ncbi:MAG: nickel-type superoxide dismutase maturation protease [Candidatus Woykebacteria bacterium GWB1_45_5]|uniref:Nickel-type superoxide dismutase maturation protease n=1 Tax=Candidatus Woykebacteria bacterium GWB1_45_5 TaxID=1802592 RepID=A0A1G1W3W0_9BACT|nr:MAG: nickel-type superoxide dismutase maturation protease [Candidatus Woykebacteria bacterium GWB1_45_5]
MFFPLNKFKVVGHSMEPAFKEGNRILVNRLAYLFSRPKPNDIVAIKHPRERDKILLKIIKMSLPKNQYFVVGINPSDSCDSRNFGSISKDLIFGKVWFSY